MNTPNNDTPAATNTPEEPIFSPKEYIEKVRPYVAALLDRLEKETDPEILTEIREEILHIGESLLFCDEEL